MSEATVTENASAPAGPSEPGPGAALQDERRRQSLSLTDVARQLKLSPRQVEALERDDFAALPGPVFVRGFLRNYARLLGLDPEPMVRTAERMLAPAQAEAEARTAGAAERSVAIPMAQSAAGPASRSRMPLYIVSAIVILVTAYLATRDRSPQPGAIDVPVVAIPTEPPATTTVPEVPPAASAPGTTSPPLPATPEVAPAPPAPAVAPAREVPPAPAAPAVRTVGSTGPAIRMTFSREAWVEVRDGSDNVIFGQLNPEGSIRVVRGQPPFSLVVGNASGVTLTYNGKAVDLTPHTRTDVARLRLE